MIEDKYSKAGYQLPWWSFLVGLALIGSAFIVSDFLQSNLPEPLSNSQVCIYKVH